MLLLRGVEPTNLQNYDPHKKDCKVRLRKYTQARLTTALRHRKGARTLIG